MPGATSKLRGPHKQWFHAYVIEDMYSRYITGVIVHTRESVALATQFVQQAIASGGEVAPDVLHSDNGPAMTSADLGAFLQAHDIQRSTSRPRVSNDNPFIESTFATIKTCPAHPTRFTTIAAAQQFLDDSVDYYNNHHPHSSPNYYTPAQVHHHTWHDIRQARQQALDEAFHANPLRFNNKHPTATRPPDHVHINSPQKPTTEI